MLKCIVIFRDGKPHLISELGYEGHLNKLTNTWRWTRDKDQDFEREPFTVANDRFGSILARANSLWAK